MHTQLHAFLGAPPTGKDSILTNDENHEDSQAKHIINEYKKQEREGNAVRNDIEARVCV
jgi:hypothetical protein